MHPESGTRRFAPRPWHTDWLMLRHLGRTIARGLAVARPQGGRLLDFGCGSMPYRALVEKHGFTYAGADFGSPTLSIDPAGTLPVPDASQDAVLSVQVLEHVRDLSRYLDEAARVLIEEGTLLLSTHGNWLYHPHPEDHRRWTRTGLVLDIEARGFMVEEIDALVGPLATTTLIRLTGFAFALRRLPLAGRAIAGGLAMVMNLRGWIEDKITPRGMIDNNACIYVVRCTKRPLEQKE